MNKELLVSIMTESFIKANIELAISSGMSEEEASKIINPMEDSISKCMNSVADTLHSKFPELLK